MKEAINILEQTDGNDWIFMFLQLKVCLASMRGPRCPNCRFLFPMMHVWALQMEYPEKRPKAMRRIEALMRKPETVLPLHLAETTRDFYESL